MSIDQEEQLKNTSCTVSVFALKGLEIRDMNTHALTSGIHYVCCGNCMHGTASLGMTLYVHVL